MKWPRTLASRLALIFFTGLVLAYGLSFGLQAYERYISSRSMMLSNLEQDVATSVAILDRLPAAERAAWLPRLERRTYRYHLDLNPCFFFKGRQDMPKESRLFSRCG